MEESGHANARPNPRSPRGRKTSRPWLNVMFNCCNVYSRIFLNHQGTAYVGHCPKCAARVVIRAEPGGSKSRFWSVG